MAKLLLPRPQKLCVQGVQLYSKGGVVEFDVSSDFTCVVGANGLGKSTFVNLVLYGITGVVLRPGHKLIPISGKSSSFWGQGRDFAKSYFEGRVARSAIDRAHVEVSFRLGDSLLIVRRGFLTNSKVLTFSSDGEGSDAEDQEAAYERAVVRLSGAANFPQFAYLVQTVQFFSEDPLCLFWLKPELNQILWAVLSGDASQGDAHTKALAEYKKHDSRVRNLQWHISSEQNMLDGFTETIGDKPDELVKEDADRYRELMGSDEEAGLIDRLEERQVELKERRSEARALRDEASLELHTHTTELEAITWRLIVGGAIPVSDSPVLRQLVDNGVCPICRRSHPMPPLVVTELTKVGACPLCRESDRPTRTNPDGEKKRITQLREICAGLRGELDDFEKALASLEDEAHQVDAELASYRQERDRLEEKHSRAALNAKRFLREQGQAGDWIQGKQTKIELLSKDKRDHLKRRQWARKRLEAAQEELTNTFDKIRDEIVPMYQGLAHEFLGIGLSLSFSQRTERGLPLVDLRLQVEGAGRQSPEELSASQRYFLDIALRMTLLAWLGRGETTPFLAVDTPEGSLDIAYEVNAGRMFAKFIATHGGQLLTVSNLNSSKLIREAITACGEAEGTVQLHDLRGVGRLNEVQAERQELMDEQVHELEMLIREYA